MGDGGPALQAGLNLPTTLALDAQGGILIAEMGERRVRRIDPDGTISTIAGDSGSGYDGDNKPATEASLTKPTGLAVTRAGDVLIADQGDQRVRRVDPSGVIHTIAGNGLEASTGDGGPASAASLSNPTSLLVDRSRRVLVTEGGSSTRVRSIERDGTINTIAGGSSPPTAGPIGAFSQRQEAVELHVVPPLDAPQGHEALLRELVDRLLHHPDTDRDEDLFIVFVAGHMHRHLIEFQLGARLELPVLLCERFGQQRPRRRERDYRGRNGRRRSPVLYSS